MMEGVEGGVRKDLVGVAVVEEPREGDAAEVALINKTTSGAMSRGVGWQLQVRVDF